MQRRWQSGEKKPASVGEEGGKKKVEMTREQVDALAHRAKAEQKFWDAMVPERSLSGVGVLLLAVVVTSLHFYNGQKDDEREEQEREDARLERAAAARRRQARLSPENREKQAAFKARQEGQFLEKLAAARAAGDGQAAAAAEERLAEIRARLAELRMG